MDLFPSIGLAVLGIFATVAFGGMMSGVIAFGVVDGGLRRRVQRGVVRRLVEEQLERFLHDQMEQEDGVRPERWEHDTIDALRQAAKRRQGLAGLLRLDPRRFYALPYRQLCGQIANAVGPEFQDEPALHGEARLQPVTAVLAMAEAANNGDYHRTLVDLDHPLARRRALQFVDTIQMELADAVLARARWCAAAAIILMLAAILVPSVGALNIYREDPSFVLRVMGGAFAAAVAVLLLAALTYAATIVAVITFRWIDRFASAR